MSSGEGTKIIRFIGCLVSIAFIVIVLSAASFADQNGSNLSSINNSNASIISSGNASNHSLEQSISNLNNTISLLKTDGVPTLDAEDLLNRDQLLLSINSGAGAMLSTGAAQQDIDSMITELYVRASMQYAALGSERTKVLQLTNLLHPFGNISQMGSQAIFDNLTYSNGSFIPEKTVGNYSRIKRAYDEIIDYSSSNTDEVISSYILERARVEKSFQTVPIVDNYTVLTTSIDLINDLPIDVGIPLTLHFDSIPINPNSKINSSNPNAVISPSGSGINVQIPGIRQSSSYNIVIDTPLMEAETISKNEVVSSLTPYDLVENTTYSIVVNDDVNTLLLSGNTTADYCTAEMNGIDQQLLLFGNEFNVRLNSVKSGATNVTVLCTTFNPIKITEFNFTNSSNELDYVINISSNITSLNNVVFYMPFDSNPSLIVPNSIRVVDLSNVPPPNFSYFLLNGEYVAKWDISSSQLPQVYQISYMTTDLHNYYNDLFSRVSNESEQERVDVSGTINDAGYRALFFSNYTEAIGSLIHAQDLINTGVNDRTHTHEMSDQLANATAILLKLKNQSTGILDVAKSLGMQMTISELNGKISNLDSEISLANSSLTLNMGAAAPLVRDLEQKAELSSLEDTIYQERASLIESLVSRESIAVAMGSFIDNSGTITAIKSTEESLNLVKTYTASSDYASSMRILYNSSFEISELDSLFINETASAVSEANSTLSHSDVVLSRWSSERSSTIALLGITNISAPTDISEIGAIVNDSDTTSVIALALLDNLTGYSPNDIVNDSSDFRKLDELAYNLSMNTNYLVSLRHEFGSSAPDSIKDTEIFFASRAGKFGNTNEGNGFKSSMERALSAANDSYNSGKYIDAISIAYYVRNSVASFTPTPQPLVDPLLIYVVIVAIVMVSIFLLLFRKEKPKSTRTTKRATLD